MGALEFRRFLGCGFFQHRKSSQTKISTIANHFPSEYLDDFFFYDR
jgi:hypothetical protein